MNSTAINFVSILSSIEKVVNSKLLTSSQKKTILEEITPALPSEFFTAQCQGTRAIIETIIKEQIDAHKEQKKATKRTQKSKKPEHGSGELF